MTEKSKLSSSIAALCLLYLSMIALYVTAGLNGVYVTQNQAEEIWVNPTSFEETVPVGNSVSRTLAIGNNSDTDLHYYIAATDTTLNSGSPDNFGYQWLDSDKPGGPVVYEWIDISITGTRLGVSDYDDRYEEVSLSFPFPFYGNEFTSIYVCSNGFITLGEGNSQRTNSPLPSGSAPANLIACFWDDLDPGTGGDIYFQDDGDKAVVQFDNVMNINEQGPYTFQAVLYADGKIRYYYQVMFGDINSATVGIQNETKDDGLEVAYNKEYLKDSLAVEFRLAPKWLSPRPASGTINPGDLAHVTVTLDTAGFSRGTYSGGLEIFHDKVTQANPLIVPCTLIVEGMRRLVASPMSYDFGKVNDGSYDTKVITLSNDGDEATEVSGINFSSSVYSTTTNTPVSIAPFSSLEVPVTFTPSAMGRFEGSMVVESNAGDNPTISISLSGTGKSPYDIRVEPDNIEATVDVCDSVSKTLIIGNSGESGVEYFIVPTDRTSDIMLSVSSHEIYDENHVTEFPEGEQDESIGSPVTLSSGGPDSFGYMWMDSDVPGEPVSYEWEDISSTGTQLTVSNCDDCYQEVSLGFTFSFYGNEFTSMYVSSNGFITFGEGADHFNNYPLPTGSAPANLIACFWDDLSPKVSGDVYFLSDGDRAVVQFDNCAHVDEIGSYTFQVILYAEDRIKCYYKMMFGDVSTATIGIQNETKDAGLTLAYNTEYVKDALAVEFRPAPGWFKVQPDSGIINPDQSIDVSITVDATGFSRGSYPAWVQIYHDNPSTANPLTIPCAFTVNGMPRLDASPMSYDFGNVREGSSDTSIIIFSNCGDEATIVNSIDFSNSVFSTTTTTPVSIMPFSSLEVPVTFTPSGMGIFEGTMTAESEQEDIPPIIISLRGRGKSPFDLRIEPENIEATVDVCDSLFKTLTIGNSGDTDLEYFIVAAHSTPDVSLSVSVHEVYDESLFTELANGEKDTGIGSPVTLSSGGPDAFGYIWMDSDDLGRPVVYEWDDISDTGTQLTLSNCDDCNEEVNLEFTFPFYGNDFNTVFVSSNGFITLGEGSDPFTNYPLPSNNAPANMIACFWDDLNPDAGGEVYFQGDGDKAVIQFDKVINTDETGTYTFQVILYANGIIRCYYKEMFGDVSSATIGIQNGTKNDGLTIAYNTEYLKNSLGVEFRHTPRWLRVEPDSGIINPDQSADISVSVDATGLPRGGYQEWLQIFHNNLTTESPLTIPCTFTVEGMPRLAALPMSYDFGNVYVGTHSTAIITLSNCGDEITEVNSITVLPPFSPDITSTSIPPFSSQEVLVTFTPSDAESYEGTMTVLSNAQYNSEIIIPLKGNGVSSLPCEISFEPLEFNENVEPGQIITRSLFITNTANEGCDDLHFEISILEEYDHELYKILSTNVESDNVVSYAEFSPVDKKLLDETGSITEKTTFAYNKIYSNDIYVNNKSINNILLNSLPLNNMTLNTLPLSEGLNFGNEILHFQVPCEADNMGVDFVGLEWRDESLWASCMNNEILYELDPADFGTVLDEVPIPGINPSGLAWDGSSFWVCDPYTDEIHRLDSTGNIIVTYDSPGSGPVGLAWDGKNLWNVDWKTASLYKIDPDNGTVVHTIPAPDTRPAGVTYDGRYLWTNGRDSGKTYKIDPSDGTIISSFFTPQEPPMPPGPSNSQCLAFDGDFLWISTPTLIIKADLEKWLSVSPSSNTIAPGETIEIIVKMDATYLDSGEYCQYIIIEHNCGEEEPPIVACNLKVRAGSISGRITDDLGNALAGIEVTSFHEDFWWPIHTFTLPDGSYTIPNVIAGCYKVQAVGMVYAYKWYDDTYNIDDATPVCLENGEHITGIDFVLEPGGSISGTVTDQYTGLPIGGVEVFVRETNSWFWWGGIQTNDEGSYTIANLPPGCHIVISGGNDYAWKHYDDTYSIDDATPVCLESGEHVGAINFALEEGGCISGIVTDEATGLPIEGAIVCANHETLPYERCTETDSDGSYEICELAPGDYTVVACRNDYACKTYDDTYKWEDRTLVPVESGEHVTEIYFTLELKGCISGEVIDKATGLPIGGVVVCADHETRDYDNRCAETDPDGSYEICELIPGGYIVRTVGNGYAEKYYNDTCIKDQATPVPINGGDITGIDFTLELAGAILGTVENEVTGIRIPGLTVQAIDIVTQSVAGEDVTGPEGEYHLNDLCPGYYIVKVVGGDDCNTEFYNNKNNPDDADPVLVNPGEETPGINFELICGPPCPPAPIIIDNGDLGTSFTGTWSISGAPDPYGVDSLFSKELGATYTYCASAAGSWEISLWWTQHDTRCTAVPIEIYDGEVLLDTIYADQTSNGGQWNVLGTFEFSGIARIVINSTSSVCNTCADAIRLAEPPSCPPAPVIIDNGDDPGTEFTGTWSISSAPDPYGVDSLFSKELGATYTYCASAAGSWEISLWWTQHDTRCTAVPIEIYDGEVLLDTIYADQTSNGGQWNVLGTFEFSGIARIVINSTSSVCNTCADAIRLAEPPSCPPAPVIIDNGDDPGTEFTGTWSISGAPDPYGVDSLFSKELGATYTYCASAAGSWEISLWWTQHDTRCTAVPIEIYDGEVLLDTIYADQTSNGGQWNVLGTFEFSGIARIVINSTSSVCNTCADA
ncbi:MAG: carboxypeptidase regulatory-like domain-containing protein, partial [bacterium]